MSEIIDKKIFQTSYPDGVQQAQEVIKSAKIFLKRTTTSSSPEQITNATEKLRSVGLIERMAKACLPTFLMNFADNIAYSNVSGWGTEFTEARDKLRQFSQLDPSNQLQLFFSILEFSPDKAERKLIENLTNFNFTNIDLSDQKLHQAGKIDIFATKADFLRLLGPNLETLNLQNSDVTSGDLAEIFRRCPNLKSLNLSRCKPLDLRGVKLPASLKELNLENAYLSKGSVKELKACPNLEHLNLNGVLLDDDELKGVDFPKLTTLQLGRNPSITSQALRELSAPNLSSLFFIGSGKLNEGDLQIFFKQHPHLKEVCFSSPLSVRSIGELANSCKELDSLVSADSSRINNLDALSGFSSLTALHLYKLESADEKSIGHLIITNPQLKELSITHSEHLNDESLNLIAVHLRNLKNLSLAFCQKASENAIYDLISKLKGLQYIDLRGLEVSNCDSLWEINSSLQTIIAPDGTPLKRK